VSEDAIVRRNAKLKKNRNNLIVGQALLICADTRRSKASKTCGYRTPIHHHEVVPGEHSAQIAGRYGVSRRELYRLNPKLKQNPNLIRTGQMLRVCPNIAPRERTKLRHSVQSGENLGSIAKRYGLTPRELERYQQGNLADRNALRVGQKLVVWRDGAIVSGFGTYDDDTGVLKTGVQLPPGQHYVVKHPTLSYGSGKTIRLIQGAISRYRGRISGGPKIHVGDISKRGGGRFPPHKSHQHGRDVDVGYVLKGELKDVVRFRNANANNLGLGRSWALVKAFLDSHEVKYIFMDRKIQKLLYEYAKSKGVNEDTLDVYFQYPRNRSHGMIRHAKGHVNHFHVRFYK
jgi:LysM repeat protein